jgi:hypothetical protein
MIVQIFQGTDIQELKKEMETAASEIPLKPSFITQSQSSIPNLAYNPSIAETQRPDITIVTITVTYE